MINSQHVKWYAQELHKLLKQSPDDPVAAQLFNTVDGFLNHTHIERIEAQAPAGVDKSHGLGLTRL